MVVADEAFSLHVVEQMVVESISIDCDVCGPAFGPCWFRS